MILHYLRCTLDKGTIVTPTGSLDLQCGVDADLCGLYHHEPDAVSVSAKSPTGLIIALGGVPPKSQLQHGIALSTVESEYCALSAAMKTLIPIRGMIVKLITFLGPSLLVSITLSSNRRQQWSSASRHQSVTYFANLKHFHVLNGISSGAVSNVVRSKSLKLTHTTNVPTILPKDSLPKSSKEFVS
jgi:hypothetical protein